MFFFKEKAKNKDYEWPNSVNINKGLEGRVTIIILEIQYYSFIAFSVKRIYWPFKTIKTKL